MVVGRRIIKGYPVLIHDPVPDAEATALLAPTLLTMRCLDGLGDLMEQCRPRWGRFNELEWMCSRGLQPSTPHRPSEANPGADSLHPMHGLRSSITGDLNPAVLRPGADITRKMKRAFELQAEGQQIEVITVYDFLAMLTDVRGH